jgi:glutamate racemase
LSANKFAAWFDLGLPVEKALVKVGIFDSGIGGLSVLREIRLALPKAELIYVADSAHAPYGEQSASFIIERSLQICDFLAAQAVDAIVIACNTASAHAAKAIRARCQIPVIAIEPAIKPAASASQSKVIAVLATTQTIASENVSNLVASYGRDIRVLLQACPGLVEYIEHGDLNSSALRLKLNAYLAPLIEQGADTIVLGCTHYPFLAPLLKELAGAKVQLIDPAPAVARELVRRLSQRFKSDASSISASEVGGSRETFYSSAASSSLKAVIESLLDRSVELRSLPI